MQQSEREEHMTRDRDGDPRVIRDRRDRRSSVAAIQLALEDSSWSYRHSSTGSTVANSCLRTRTGSRFRMGVSSSASVRRCSSSAS